MSANDGERLRDISVVAVKGDALDAMKTDDVVSRRTQEEHGKEFRGART